METRTKLADASIEAVMLDIEQTEKDDLLLDANDFSFFKTAEYPHGFAVEVGGRQCRVNDVALGQIDAGMLSGFAGFADNLRSAGMTDLYLQNVNELIGRGGGKKLYRIARKNDAGPTLRAWLSSSYQRIDDDTVFGTLIDAVEQTRSAGAFQSIGGIRTDRTSCVKLVTRDPLFSIQADGRERAFHPGFILSNSEVGQGYCKIEVLLIDRFCTNGCIFSADRLGSAKLLHRGADLSRMISGPLAAGVETGVAGDKMRRMIFDAVKIAFDKDRYLDFRAALQTAAELRISGGPDGVEAYSRVIGKSLGLTRNECRAVSQRMIETGDRTLFGVQAALTEEAKYAATYERKLELERAGGRIFSEIPGRWKTIRNLADAELLDRR